MNNEIREMTDRELEVTNGGIWPIFFAGVAAAVAGYVATGIIENWEDFKKGVVEGYNSVA